MHPQGEKKDKHGNGEELFNLKDSVSRSIQGYRLVRRVSSQLEGGSELEKSHCLPAQLRQARPCRSQWLLSDMGSHKDGLRDPADLPLQSLNKDACACS